MRNPDYLVTHTTEILRIWHTGWGIAIHPTPVGVFFRLEKGIFFRGGPLRGWWWARTVDKAVAKLVSEAQTHPRLTRRSAA